MALRATYGASPRASYPAIASGALPWERTSDAGAVNNALSLLTGGTFTRASEGSYLTGAPTDGSTPFLAWAANDVRRVENRGDGLGAMLLLEGSRTNQVFRSRDVTNAAAWTAAGSATQTAAAGFGPDGTSVATRIQASVANFSRGQAITGRMTSPHTVSAYGRPFTGSPDWRPNYIGVSAWTGVLASAWVRKSLLSATTGGNLYAEDGTLGGGAADLLVDLWQAENGSFPSSPIRTTTVAVTRAADALSYTTGSYPIGFLTSGVSVVIAPDASSAEIVADALDMRIVHVGTAGDFVRIRQSGANCVVDLVCGTVVVATLTVTFSRAQMLTITAKPSAGSLTVAGATTGNGTNTGSGAAWASAQTLYVGGDNAGANNLFGRIGTIAQAA